MAAAIAVERYLTERGGGGQGGCCWASLINPGAQKPRLWEEAHLQRKVGEKIPHLQNFSSGLYLSICLVIYFPPPPSLSPLQPNTLFYYLIHIS